MEFIIKSSLPQTEVNITGLRPNLSDHGPIKRLSNTGIIASIIDRVIKILAAYGSTIVSIAFKYNNLLIVKLDF